MRLITQAKVDAEHIAAIVLKGIDARKKIILTDRLGHQASYLSSASRGRSTTGCSPPRRSGSPGGPAPTPDDFVP